MIEADLRGKLGYNAANAHERSEDLLTSTVFGLLRYLPAADAMFPLMEHAKPVELRAGKWTVIPTTKLLRPWIDLSGATTFDVEFWPSFHPHGQPDILLTFRNAYRSPVHLVVVEAKLHSPKSGDGAADDENVDAQVPPEISMPRDQLCRYWDGLLKHHSLPPSQCSVIYLTAHATPPLDDLNSSLELRRDMRLAWMSWRDIWHVVAPIAIRTGETSAAGDLKRLLAHRRFKPLDGFKMEVPALTDSGRFWVRRPWFAQSSFPVQDIKLKFWEAL